MQPVTERLSPTIRALIVIQALVYGAYLFVPSLKVPIAEHLALGPAMLLHGELWQPVTSLFVHLNALTFFFDLIGLWFVGAALERELGRRRFYVLFFAPAIAGNVVYGLVVGLSGRIELTAGCGLGVLALFVAFGHHYGRAQARVLGGLVMEARSLAALLVAFSLFVDVTQAAWPSLAASVVAVALAYGLAGGRGRFARDLLARGKRTAPGKGKPPARKRRFDVVQGGRGKDDGDDFLN
jgi:membrane associated rhomboid family serine protease